MFNNRVEFFQVWRLISAKNEENGRICYRFVNLCHYFVPLRLVTYLAVSMSAGTAPVTMALVSAAILFILHFILFYIKCSNRTFTIAEVRQYGRALTIVEFFMFPLRVTTTCFCSLHVTTCYAVGTSDACGRLKAITGFSATNSLLNLSLAVYRVAFVHVPSWKQGVIFGPRAFQQKAFRWPSS